MSNRIDPRVRVVYGRLWQYVIPHKLVGFVAVFCMAMTAVVEAGLVALLRSSVQFPAKDEKYR